MHHAVLFKQFPLHFRFATSFNAMITSTSEFCHGGIRDRVLLCQLSFNGLAQIVIAGFSWAILTQDWYLSFNDGYFGKSNKVFGISWNSR